MLLYKSSIRPFHIFSLAEPKSSMALMCSFCRLLTVCLCTCLFSSVFVEVFAPLHHHQTAGSSPLDGMMDDPWDAVLCHNQMFQRDSALSIRPRLRPLSFPPHTSCPLSLPLFARPATDTSNLATALSGDVGEQKKKRFGLDRFSSLIAASTRISPR